MIYLDRIELNEENMKYAIWMKNIDLIDYMLNKKYIISNNDFLIMNYMCDEIRHHTDLFKILDVFIKYNYYILKEI